MGCICDGTFQPKKGRGQRKSRRDRRGRNAHRSNVIISKFYHYHLKRGLTVEQMREMITFE